MTSQNSESETAPAVDLHRVDMRLEVVEYWPGFVDRSDEPRRTIVNTKAEVEGIPWLKEKGPIVVDGFYVKRWATGFIVATIHPVVGDGKSHITKSSNP